MLATSLVIIFIVFMLILWWLGLFRYMPARKGNLESHWLVYRYHQGPYHETGKVLAQIEEELSDLGIAPEKGFGFFYDDPKEMEANDLRSILGFMIAEPNEEKQEAINKLSLTLVHMPQTDTVETYFPMRGTASYMIGPIKAYASIDSYSKKRQIDLTCTPLMEIYDTPQRRIWFLAPLDIQPEWFNELIPG